MVLLLVLLVDSVKTSNELTQQSNSSREEPIKDRGVAPHQPCCYGYINVLIIFEVFLLTVSFVFNSTYQTVLNGIQYKYIFFKQLILNMSQAASECKCKTTS